MILPTTRRSDLQNRPCRDEQLRPRPGVREHERKQERAGIARPDYLQRAHVQIEVLRRGVEQGEAENRTAHERNAGQPLPALVRRVVVHWVEDGAVRR